MLQEEKDSSFRSKYGESWDKVGVASASLFQVSMQARKEGRKTSLDEGPHVGGGVV